MKSLKLKIYPGEDITDCCAVIVVDADHPKSAGDFKNKHLGYITRIFEDNSDSILHPWEIQKYNEVIEFIKKLHVSNMGAISPEEIITFESLVQEATH